MGARVAVPLRVLLPCLAVGLAASGAVAAGLVLLSGTSGYLMQQADQEVRACAGAVLSRGLVTVPGSAPAPGQEAACGVELLSAGGQVLVPADAGAAAGPAVPPGPSWLTAHLDRPVTIPGPGTGGRWRVLVTAVRYQARRIPYVYGADDMRYLVGGPAGPGQPGLAAVMAGLAGTGQVAAGYAAAAGVVLVLLAAAVLAAVRAITRPRRLAATLAALSAPPTAGNPAETAAGQAARQMSARLAEVSLELRAPVHVVHGFAQYCRQRGTPPPASLDRMMRRIAGEATRMDALLAGLEAAPPSGPAGDPAPRVSSGCRCPCARCARCTRRSRSANDLHK